MRASREGLRGPSYAVLWRHPEGPVCSGKLMFESDGLRLEGIDRSGEPAALELPYAAVSGARVARGARERIDGRPSLAIESPGSTLLVTSTVGLGMIHEMAGRLSDLVPSVPA